MIENTDFLELYKNDKRIHEYIDKYMAKHDISEVETALKCKVVRNYIEYVVKEGK